MVERVHWRLTKGEINRYDLDGGSQERAVAWVEPIYSRADVNRAGRVLMASSDPVELAESRMILSNWRSAHGFPLNTLAVTLKSRAAQVTKKAIIAQRLKRLVSIENKLLRLSEVRATQIQDIGGARIILPNMKQLKAVHTLYAHGRSGVFKMHRTDDYIDTPKSSGYRSLHIVYRYDSPRKPQWSNMRVELQLRTRVQHAWAAAVEAVSFFSGQDLKANEGHPPWLRFFELMAHWMSYEEQCAGVPTLRDAGDEYLQELEHLWTTLEVDTVLAGWTFSLEEIKDMQARKGAWRFLLHLDAKAKTIQITGFGRREEGEASERYAALESQYREQSDQHIVLVTVADVKQLETAYPGFFADTTLFRESAARALAARQMRSFRNQSSSHK